MSHSRENLLLITGAVIFLGVIVLGNTLYKISSRHGVPMFSYEALALGWPYWVGGLIGLAACGACWFFRRGGRGDDA